MHRQKFLLFRVYRFQDPQAYAELYDAFVPRIRRYISFKVSHSPSVEELTSEVFLRGWEYATSSHVKNGGALFYRIARNIVADHYRSMRIEEVDLEEVKHAIPSKEDVAHDIAVREEASELIEALKHIKEEYQDVLVMRYIDEMSVKEIAGVLEKTPNNVRVLIHRAKQALQTHLQKTHVTRSHSTTEGTEA